MKPDVPLEAVIYRLIDGQLADDEREQLIEVLRTDPAARAEYYELMAQHAILHHELGGFTRETVAQRAPEYGHRRGWQFFTRPAPLSLSVSAGVMFLLLSALALLGPPAFRAFSSRNATPEKIPLEFVAQLTGEYNAQWQSGSAGTSLGSQIAVGRRLKLTHGLAQFHFRSGAIVLLEGPAELEFLANSSGFLKEGKLTARTANESFTVQTSQATIVDLGTEFGVDVNSTNEVGVYVFEGKVEVQQANEVVSLIAGQSLLINSNTARPTSVNTASFARRLPEILDVGDMVAGGTGKERRREAGIHLADGRSISQRHNQPISGTPQYRTCDEHPLVDGVFVVAAGNINQQINSAGQTSNRLESNLSEAWNCIWTENNGSVYFHANAGVTFDLRAIHRQHGAHAIEFDAMIDSTTQDPGTCRVIVLVDNRVVLSEIVKHGATTPVRVPLSPEDRFLTLVATDAGDGLRNDGIWFRRPRIRLQPQPTKSAAASSPEAENKSS